MKKKAFTLAETIMTLAIIGLVITAAIPAMTSRTFNDNSKLKAFCEDPAHAADVRCQRYLASRAPFVACSGTDTSCLFTNNAITGDTATGVPYKYPRFSGSTFSSADVDFSFALNPAFPDFWSYIHSENITPFRVGNYFYKEDGTNLFLINQGVMAFPQGSQNTVLGSLRDTSNLPALGNKHTNFSVALGLGLGTFTGNTVVGINNFGLSPKTNNTVIGTGNTVANATAIDKSIVLGNNNTINHSNAAVIGANNTTPSEGSLIVGHDITDTNLVSLGSNLTLADSAAATPVVFNCDEFRTGATFNNVKFLIASDLRLKNINGSYTKGLNEVLAIKPVTFYYNADATATEKIGVIAQDVQKVFPEAVKKMPGGYFGVDNAPIFFAMINSLKELDNLTISEEKRQRELKSELDSLERELFELTTCKSNSFIDKIKCFIMRIIFDWRGI